MYHTCTNISCSQDLNYLAFQNFDYKHNQQRLFQQCAVYCTKLDTCTFVSTFLLLSLPLNTFSGRVFSVRGYHLPSSHCQCFYTDKVYETFIIEI